MSLVINNFKYVYGEPKKEKSNYLKLYKSILDYNVYRTTINPSAFVVHDSTNNDYYNFERVIDNFENIDTDLEIVIKNFIIQKNE